MFRKLSTLLTAVVVIFAMLPALAASAAVQTTAAITAPATRQVFPTLAGDQPSAITVRVTNPQGSVLDLGNALPANAVRIVMPAGLSQPACGAAPDGWSCQAVITPNASAVLYTTATNPIARGEAADFGFTARIGAPGNADRRSVLEVEVSDDLGNSFTDATATSAGSLDLVTKVLQIVPESLTTALGTAARDRFTEGQTVVASYVVRNYAFNTVTVTPALGGVPSGDTATPRDAALSVPGQGGTATAVFDVATAATASLSRTADYSASASIPDTSTTSNTAAFPQVTLERAVTVDTDSSRFLPNAIPDNVTRTFRLGVDKDELPAIEGLTGTLDLRRDADDPATSEAIIPIDGAESDALARGPQTDLTLVFEAVQLELGLVDQNLILDGVLSLSGTDDNGRAYSEAITLEDLLTIDALAPVIDLNPITIVSAAANQTRANGGNSISITGTVESSDVALQNRQVDESGNATGSGVVVTVTAAGQTFPVPVTFSGSSFSGQFPISNIPPAAEGGRDFGDITAAAVAFDFAENSGSADPEMIQFDRIAPTLAPNGIAIIDPLYDDQPVVKVSFVEQYAEPAVRGGCLETMWEVDNAIVVDVLYEDGSTCSLGSTAPNNVRILVLNTEIDPENAGTVDFISTRNILGIGDDPVSDSAVNRALSAARQIVSGVAPTIPTILDVTRTNLTGADTSEVARESMGVFDGRYHTNVEQSTDPVVVLDPANVSNSYTINIYRVAEGGTPVASTSAADGNRQVEDVPIDICGSDCTQETTLYAELVNVVNQNGSNVILRSPRRPFTIVFDSVLPEIVNAQVSGDGVLVTYNEALRSGRDSAADWFGLELNESASPDEPRYFAYGVDAVSTVADQPAQRQLAVNLGENGPFSGVDFFSTAEVPATSVYEDFAGNFSAVAESFLLN